MKKYGIFEESRRVSHIFKTGGPVEQYGIERKFKYKGLTCDSYSRNQTIPTKGARSNLNKSCGCDTATNIACRKEEHDLLISLIWPRHGLPEYTVFCGFSALCCAVVCSRSAWSYGSLPIRRVSNADNAFV